MNTENRFPPGSNDERVKNVLAHYDDQDENEQFVEIEAALSAENTTLMAIPTDLVPEVQAILARPRTT